MRILREGMGVFLPALSLLGILLIISSNSALRNSVQSALYDRSESNVNIDPNFENTKFQNAAPSEEMAASQPSPDAYPISEKAANNSEIEIESSLPEVKTEEKDIKHNVPIASDAEVVNNCHGLVEDPSAKSTIECEDHCRKDILCKDHRFTVEDGCWRGRCVRGYPDGKKWYGGSISGRDTIPLVKLSEKNYSLGVRPPVSDNRVVVLSQYELFAEGRWFENNVGDVPRRQKEITTVFLQNYRNPQIKSVHLLVYEEHLEKTFEHIRQLVEDFHENKISALMNQTSDIICDQPNDEAYLHNRDPEAWMSGSNIGRKHVVVRGISQPPTPRIFLLYSTTELAKEVVAYLNMDVYLGEGFEKLDIEKFRSRNNIAYALSRFASGEAHKSACKSGFVGSADSYVYTFESAISEDKLRPLEYPMNAWGGENALIGWLRSQGKNVLNPCYILTSYHLHCTRLKGPSSRLRLGRENGRSFGTATPTKNLGY